MILSIDSSVLKVPSSFVMVDVYIYIDIIIILEKKNN